MKNNIKKILKEFDDFDWIRETTPNLFMVSDYIVLWIDSNMTKENIDSEIPLIKEAGYTSYNWDNFVKEVFEYSTMGETYIRCYLNNFGNKVVSYGNSSTIFNESKHKNVYRVEDYVEYNLKDIIGGNINESDGLDWIRDIEVNEVTRYNVYEGDRVRLNPESKYYHQAEGIIGTVDSLDTIEEYEEGTEFWVRVNWDGGSANVYQIGNRIYDLLYA